MEAKKRFISQYIFTEYEPSELEEEIVKAVLEQLQDKEKLILTPKENSEMIGDDMFPPGDTPKQKGAKVGWAIKKFNLSSEKKPRAKDGVRYLFEKNKVDGIYKSYFKTATEPTPPTLNLENSLGIEDLIV